METEDSTAKFQLSLASDVPDLFRGRAQDEDLSIQIRKATLSVSGDAGSWHPQIGSTFQSALGLNQWLQEVGVGSTLIHPQPLRC